jgi:hypothetical protein
MTSFLVWGAENTVFQAQQQSSDFGRNRQSGRLRVLFYFILHLLYDVMDIHLRGAVFRDCE